MSEALLWDGHALYPYGSRGTACRRDKNEFSKMAIKRLFRDSLTRESILCAPWTVTLPLAKRYGIPTEIPESVAKISEAERKSQIEKRRRTLTKEPAAAEVVEEGPPSKKQKVEGAPSEYPKHKLRQRANADTSTEIY